ncbi:hypothetical protein [Streptomyces sp. NPDC002758]
MHATDFSPVCLSQLAAAAEAEGLAERVTTTVHDVRAPLPLADASTDAVFTHMLLRMAPVLRRGPRPGRRSEACPASRRSVRPHRPSHRRRPLRHGPRARRRHQHRCVRDLQSLATPV